MNWLRATVSRFVEGPTHARRRALVDEELSAISLIELRRAAWRHGPIEALAFALGVSARAVGDTVTAVGTVARGYPSGATTADRAAGDAAVATLVDLVGSGRWGRGTAGGQDRHPGAEPRCDDCVDRRRGRAGARAAPAWSQREAPPHRRRRVRSAADVRRRSPSVSRPGDVGPSAYRSALDPCPLWHQPFLRSGDQFVLPVPGHALRSTMDVFESHLLRCFLECEVEDHERLVQPSPRSSTGTRA